MCILYIVIWYVTMRSVLLKNDVGIFLLKGPKIGTFALSTENQAWEVANEFIGQISVLIAFLTVWNSL